MTKNTVVEDVIPSFLSTLVKVVKFIKSLYFILYHLHSYQSAMSNNITAIANRIQDRANQLSNERLKLQQLQSDLSTLQQQFSNETTIHNSYQEELLTQTRTLHEYEIDILRYKRLIKDLDVQIQNHSNEKQNIQFQIQNLGNDIDLKNDSIFVPHQYDTLIYKRKLDCRVHELKEKRRKREKMLDRLLLETERDREEVQSMEREGRRLKDEIKMMEDVEVREDEEIASVAMQIRATLAKVSVVVDIS